MLTVLDERAVGATYPQHLLGGSLREGEAFVKDM